MNIQNSQSGVQKEPSKKHIVKTVLYCKAILWAQVKIANILFAMCDDAHRNMIYKSDLHYVIVGTSLYDVYNLWLSSTVRFILSNYIRSEIRKNLN